MFLFFVISYFLKDDSKNISEYYDGGIYFEIIEEGENLAQPQSEETSPLEEELEYSLKTGKIEHIKELIKRNGNILEGNLRKKIKKIIKKGSFLGLSDLLPIFYKNHQKKYVWDRVYPTKKFWDFDFEKEVKILIFYLFLFYIPFFIFIILLFFHFRFLKQSKQSSYINYFIFFLQTKTFCTHFVMNFGIACLSIFQTVLQC